MEYGVARNLIVDTFQNSFEKDRFTYFTSNLLSQIDYSKHFAYHGQYIPEAYRGHINKYERIGTYIDAEGNKTDILIVYLQKYTGLDRARTAQRNFIARYLKERDEKDAGLVAFVSPNEDDWRFSFVKMEYKFVETAKGNIKAKEEFTPAKRYSFLVGKNEDSHTAQSRLIPLLIDDERTPTLNELEETFSIEKVTKDFFEKYRELYLRTKEALEETVQRDARIQHDFTAHSVSTVDFSKKLLGQIIFLYFLQKKGWFGVKRTHEWGTGSKHFLRELFKKKHGDYRNFFNDILEPLFYNTLAVERSKDYSDRFDCKIPFLNGGLFDPINNYDWVDTEILLPDELFSNDVKTKEGDKGTGILDVFDRYNFTVKEDEPLEKEVAVDPEMLGKVFENLLEVTDRKSKGTYYTPREIVHYMCQESLSNYLVSELAGKATKEDIDNLIRYGETVVEHDRRVVTKGKETETYSFKLPESIRDHAELIDEKLRDIRVCDPAIGSGAFPVGMMSEIIRARNALTTYLGDEDNRTMYKFKRHAIHDCLYGVDIDPGAVEIAKLRLWLSLMVDEEDIKKIKPLPNLDYKIMQGNSLLEEYEGIRLFDDNLISAKPFDEEQVQDIKKRQSVLERELKQLHDVGKLTEQKRYQLESEHRKLTSTLKKIINPKKTSVQEAMVYESGAKEIAKRLKRLHEAFFDTYHKKRKDEIKKEIDDLEWELIEATLKEENREDTLKRLQKIKQANIKPFFLWKLNYSEVFQENGGFDIVIANPPYVKEDTNKTAFDGVRQSECYQGKMDLWYLFGGRGLDVLKKDGIICFIATNNWISNDGASKFRNKIIREAQIVDFIDFGNYKIFAAGIQTMVFVMKKSSENQQYILNYGKLYNDNANSNLLIEFLNQSFASSKPDYSKFIVSLERSYFIDRYINFIPSYISNVLNKIRSKDVIYLEDSEVFSGIDVMQDFVTKRHINKLGKSFSIGDGIYVISSNDKKAERWNEEELEIIKPYYTTKEVNKYYSNPINKYWIFYSNKEINNRPSIYPKITNHLDKFQSIITSVNKPYGLHRTRNRAIFIGDKLLSIRKCIAPSFSFVDFPCYVSRAFMIIKSNRVNLKYLLAILNSKLIAFWLRHQGKLQGNQYQIDKVPLMNIPIKVPSTSIQESFSEIVDKIYSITLDVDYMKNSLKKSNIEKYEHQIDQLVYELYGLTGDELSIVEGKVNAESLSNQKSELIVNIEPAPTQSSINKQKSNKKLPTDHSTWKLLSNWAKTAPVNTYWIDFSSTISNKIKKGSKLTAKEQENMKKCWKQAVKNGFEY